MCYLTRNCCACATFVMVKAEYFTHMNHTVSYLKVGEGSELIMAFHGFGMDRMAFSDFHRLVKPHQTFVSIDLFSHGKSTAHDFSGISRDEWGEVFSAFLNHLGHKRFSLMAYSLGGKVVLETVNLFSSQVDQLLLCAADGFKRVKFYEFLSLSPIGRWTYRRILNNPEAFLTFSRTLTNLRIIPSSLNKFVHYHIGDKTRRELIYDVYRVYRHFIPDLTSLREAIDTQNIQITFLYGKHDRVIRHTQGEKFIAELPDKTQAKIFLLDKGHVILDADTASFVEENHLWFGNSLPLHPD